MLTKELELSGIQQIDADWTPEVPDSQALLKDLGILDVKLLDSYRIKTPEEYVIVGRISLRAHGNVKAIKELYEDECRRRDQLHTKVTDARKADLELPLAIQKIADRELNRWDDEQKRLKAVEQARLDREQAEKDRLKREEAARIEREAAQKAAELRRQGEMSEAKAIAAQAQEQAAQLIEEADTSVGVIVADTTPKLQGISHNRPWVGEVIDLKRICLAIGNGEIPLEYMTPVRGQADQMRPLVTVDQAVLNNLAKRLAKENIGIPGAIAIREGFIRHGKGAW